MFIGSFSERPYQDERLMNRRLGDLMVSNSEYDPGIGHKLYNRYIDEKIYAEQMGFDGVVLNEHHSTFFCMGNVMNIEAAILARVTERVKIVLLGNVLPIHEDPIFLAEQLAMIDVISGGRLVSGWVRGNGRESVTHDVPTPYNWERFQEAHDLIKAAWERPGPFRWEGDHYQFRYVNPWPRPLQQPSPPMWVPGALSRNTVKWAAERGYPYVMLATELEPTRQSLDYYREVAREMGYEAGPQNFGYMFKVHVEETEELAERTARKYLAGVSNIFIEGNEGLIDEEQGDTNSGTQLPWERKPFPALLRNLPGMTQTNNLLPTADTYRGRDGGALRGGGAAAQRPRSDGFERQVEKYTIIYGTPTTVIPKIRHVLETLRPGTAILWDGDGSMSHEDTIRSMTLMGSEVIPAMREMAQELGLVSPFEEPAPAPDPDRIPSLDYAVV